MRAAATRVLSVAVKELRQLRRDPTSLVILVGMPAALLLLFGFALTLDVRHVPLAVHDGDGTAASRDLAGAFTRTGAFDLVARAPDRSAAERLLDEGRVRAALVIPPGYARRLAAGDAPRVQLLVDGADSNTARVAIGHAALIAARVGRDGARVEAAPLRPAFEVRARVFFNPGLESAHFIVPGLLGTVVLIAVALMTATSVARERELGTLEALLATPIGRLELVVGKTLPFVAVAVLDVALALATAHHVFGVPLRGSGWTLAALTAAYIATALGLGLLISTAARTQQAAFQITLMTTLLPSFLLSGFVFPVENMVPAVQAVADLVPARYYVRALRAVILEGARLDAVARDLGALGVFAVGLPLLAATRFRERLG